MLKQLIRSGPFQASIGALLAGYMQLVKSTTRWEVRGLETIEPIWASGQGVIGCVWHARVLMTIAGWPKTVQPATILISRSPDGEFVARAAKAHRIGVIRGSARNKRKTKEKGGMAAFRAMVGHVEGGGCMAITPDGPRGPRMRASVGAVRLARATGAPMMAFAWSTRHRIAFNSWDRFILPLPFGRGVIVWRGPIAVGGDSEDELEAARTQLEVELNAATHEADEAAGVEVITPAPLKPTPDPAPSEAPSAT